ncbi:MAG: hypothetical protein GY847_08320 [Proteobacteria bacterium]|nr:hypothetical protein [Pseudomonadota bacterium]
MMRSVRVFATSWVLLICFILLPTPPYLQSPKIYTQQELIDDARQLAQTIEASHPDPYINGGGKIAFHRRFQEVLSAIPKAGMSKHHFFELLLPFISTIGDSHTAIRIPETASNPEPGLPLGFRIVEEWLIVDRVPAKTHELLLGGRLLAVQGIGIDELRRRQARLRGIENRYGELAFLCYLSFSSRQGLETLIPEWKNPARIEVTLETVLGKKKKVTFPISDKDSSRPSFLKSKIELPSTKASVVAYGFLDNDRKTAILVIEDMMNYREACESWFADGLGEALEFTKSAYKRFNPGEPPKNREALLAGIPSATETFISLVREMKKAGTEHLIIDLRQNTGGNSLMRDILIYILFGSRALISMNDGYSITKYSDLFFDNYKERSLKGINGPGASMVLTQNDYDFREEQRYRKARGNSNRLSKENQRAYSSIPSFWKVYQSKKYHRPYHTLKKVAVLSSPFTYSSGFNMLTSLYIKGALIVGTPSAQPGNNFGDILFVTLRHTKIMGGVSFKRNLTFPDDPAKGQLLKPDFEMTYEQFRAHQFDANAEVLLALEVLSH